MSKELRPQGGVAQLVACLGDVLASEQFADVTLWCEGRRIRAHRLLLSASSPYLQSLLEPLPANEDATLILDKMRYEDVRNLLEFVYTGVTTVGAESLEGLLEAARVLGVGALGRPERRPCLPPLRARPILTPCPWAQHATHPLGLAPRPRPPQETRSFVEEEEPVIPARTEPKPSPSPPQQQREPGPESTPMKLCALKERRLKEFYREQRMNGVEEQKVENPTDNSEDRNNNREVGCGDCELEGPFDCTLCHRQFELRGLWEAHQRLHVQQLACTHCSKVFHTRAALKVHTRTHTGEKPFQCADCGKQFSQLRNYKYHRSVHEGTREFAATCPECGKYFNDRGYLSSHMKIHRNRKEYACEYCGKSFNQRVAYNMHVRIHTGLKPHSCPHCPKSFSRKMLLKQHLRIHTGEKPFSCLVCGKAFADRSNMTLHMRLHSGVKPYSCNLCSKAFTKKHHLKTHMNYHTGVKPYACAKCGLKFSQSSNMRTHFKKCAASPEQPVSPEQAESCSPPQVPDLLPLKEQLPVPSS